MRALVSPIAVLSPSGFRRHLVADLALHIRVPLERGLEPHVVAVAFERLEPLLNRIRFNSDHGCQYVSYAFRQRLVDTGITASLGSDGDSFDNAMAESWFGTIKVELLYRHIWRTRHKAEMAIFRWIEGWYNPRRIQARLGWRSPLEFEAAYAADKTCRSPPPPSLHRSSVRSSKLRLTAPAGRSTIEMARPTRRMDHEERIDDPGFQLIQPPTNRGNVSDQHVCFDAVVEAVVDGVAGPERRS